MTFHSPSKSHSIKVKTVFLSDLHLGTRFAKVDYLLDFLYNIDPEQIILVGDIIDIWSLKTGWHWKQSHTNVIRRLLSFAKQGKRVIYIPGNHDETFREYVNLSFGEVQIKERIEYRTMDGKRLMVVHGDQYDVFMRSSYRWLAHVGDKLFHGVQNLSRLYQRFRQFLGLKYWSLAGYLKDRTKSVVKVIGRFEEALITAAKREGYDGVICGHIHHAEIREIDGLQYYNTGDWVDSCTALVERQDGRLEVIRWIDIIEGRSQMPQAIPETLAKTKAPL